MAVHFYDGSTEYAGCVLRLWERNGYHDSDFYADVVDIEKGTIISVEYDTTRCGGYGSAEVDITPENYRAYLHARRDTDIACAIADAVKQAKAITKGKEVCVIKGRKVPHGICGQVFWTKEVDYDPYHRNWACPEIRIGIRDSEGNVYWTYAKNVEVKDYRRYMPTSQAIIKFTKRFRSEQFRKI